MSKNKLIISVFICVLVFISCDLNLKLDSRIDNDTVINENDTIQDNFLSIENDAKMGNSNKLVGDSNSFFEDDEHVDVISFYDNTELDIYDTMTFESKNNEFNDKVINTYLTERAFNPYEPTGVISRGEVKLGEYYIDKTNEKIAFVLRVWNLELETPNQVYISCITFDMAYKQNIGYVQYDYNDNEQLFKEIFYDKEFMMISDIEYELNNHFPFHLVRKYSTSSNDNKHVYEVLNRNEKFFFFTDRMNQTTNGLPIEYIGDIFHINQYEDFESNSDQLTFSYDQENRLKGIKGSFVNEDFYDNNNQGESYESMLNVEIHYLIGSDIDYIKYSTPALMYGSYDSTGELYYDEFGRMIYNSHYVTHGSIEQFYFYRENEINPFICIKFDSMPQKSEVIEGVTFMYGNYTEIYMYDTFTE